jgi:osmotically-inducible protein OsmY
MRASVTRAYVTPSRSFCVAGAGGASLDGSIPTEKGAFVLTSVENGPLEEAVITRLSLDPRIPESAELAVGASDGLVTLRGTVESFAQHRAAIRDARGADGAYEVDDQLRVNLLGSSVRDDDEIRGAALQILMWDAEVPAEWVDVKVQEGWVTLTGRVDYQFQGDAAFEDVASLYGVVGINNDIRVVTP